MISLTSKIEMVMNEHSDEQLFDLMKNRASNPDLANKAWGLFFEKYKKYLWRSCLHYCKSIPDGHEIAKDLFQTTMQKIYVNAWSYDQRKNSGVKAWIGRIAYNEFQDYLKEHYLKFTNEVPDDRFEDESFEFDNIESEQVENMGFEKLKMLLSRLSEREYKILITYMNYYQLDNPESHIPDNALKELCDEFNITSSTARQIKRRTLLKLKKMAEGIV